MHCRVHPYFLWYKFVKSYFIANFVQLTYQKPDMDNNNIYSQIEVSETIETLSKQLSSYFASQPISKAWLFGSRSRGDYREDSDYDILVSFDKTIGLFKYASIISDLENLLKKGVDLVSETSLLPWVRENVEKEKILIYERKD